MRWISQSVLFGRRHWKRLLAGIVLSLGTFMGGVALWAFHDLPDIDTIEAGMTLPATRIYDRNETLLYEIVPPEQGRNRALTLDEIPQHCINAVIATEDANYWSHPGVDPEGILRAAWINLRGGDIIAGGSTITQQTARLLLLDPQQQAERTIRRKLREMALAIQLQNRSGKEHVLTLYLNQVYFGNLAYGLEGAARAYFHKSAADLSLAECALLAGMVQNPILHDPLSDLESAQSRQQIVLGLMHKEDYISAAQMDTAERDELQFGSVRFPIEAPHFVMAVWKQLERQYPQQVYGGGLDVITTVDLNWQQTAQRIAQRQLAALNSPENGVPANARNTALIALDPHTGQVLTMLGSPDYFDESIDGAVNATLASRQPGSALKPFTFAAAMNPQRDNPMTAATVLLDVKTPFVTRRLESYTPSNFGQVEHGPVTVRESLGSSYNIPAVLALEDVGLQAFRQLAGEAGMDTLVDNSRVDLSITLGGGEVRLLDLAAAYSIFSNGGYRLDPSMILKVTARDGRVLYEWDAPPLNQQVLDERVAYLITDILSDNSARIPSFGEHSAMQIGRPAAAKTGTTTDFRDNWIVGYTPNLVVGVWVGNADNTPMVEVTGVSGAGPIYNQFMRQVLLGQPKLDFERPADLLQVEVCELSGKLPTPQCARRQVEWFIPGTQPTDYDDWYQEFTIDRRTGLVADERTPIRERITRTYLILPQEVRDWGRRNGIESPPDASLVAVPQGDDRLRLLSPDPYTVFEFSPITPRETQRLRFRVGVPADTEQVTYYLNEQAIGTVDAAPWVLWWPLQIGQHELTAVVTLADGSTETSEAAPFTVVEYSPPQPRTVLPGE